MVWLQPIGSTASAVAPPLDDAAALENPADLAARRQLEEGLAARQAERQQDFSGIFDALGSSPAYFPAGKALTSKQLETVRSQPSPYLAGVVGAASQPRHTGRPVRVSNDPVSQDRVRRALIATEAAVTTSSAALQHSVTTGYMGNPSEGLGSMVASSSRASTPHDGARAPQVYHIPGTTPRSRSLIHLDTLPSKLAEPLLRPVGPFGAAVGPLGLGPRGDEELSDYEHAQLMLQLQREEQKRVVAPQASTALARSISAPAPLHTAGPGATWPEGATPTRSLAQSSSSHMLKLPSPHDLRQTVRLGGLVPPEENTSMMRAKAAERRASRYGSAPVAVRLSPSPMRFSSVASRLASPNEFFATIAESEGSVRGSVGADGVFMTEPSRYHPSAMMASSSSAPALPRYVPSAPTPHAARATAQKTPMAPASTAPHGGHVGGSPPPKARDGQRAPPPSRESVVVWHTNASAPAPAAPPAAAPRYAREWVNKQAGLEADFSARRAAGGLGQEGRLSAVRVPWKAQATNAPPLNFISNKPAPAPPRNQSVAHAPPWIADSRGATPSAAVRAGGGMFR